MIVKLLGTLLFIGAVLLPTYPSSQRVVEPKPQQDVMLQNTKTLLEERLETYRNNMQDYSARLDSIIKILNQKEHAKKDHTERVEEEGFQ